MAQYNRPAGLFNSTSTNTNMLKYRTDSAATSPRVPISSTKVDGDFNYLIDAVNELFDDLQSAVIAGLPSLAGHTGEYITNDGTNVTWGPISPAAFAPGSIDGAKIADDSLTSQQIATGAIGNSELGTNAVGTSNVQDASLTTAKYVDASVTKAKQAIDAKTEAIVITIGSESGAVSTGTGKISFRMPYAFTVTAVRASLRTAQASGSILTIDINETSTSILSTLLTIDNTETTSATAAVPPVISDASIANDAVITIDVDQIGDGTAAGLKVTIIGYPS